MLERLCLDDPRWRSFVERRQDATPFHRPEWASVLAECYGLEGFVLAGLDEAGAVRCGLPLLASPHPLHRSRRLVSLPFTDAMSPLVDEPDAPAFARALEESRASHRAARIEIRGPLEGAAQYPARAVTHALRLADDPQALLPTFSQMRRRNLRVAASAGLTVHIAESEREVTETFYRLYLATRRRLGVPTQPKRLFSLVWRRLIEPGHGFVLTVRRRRLPIASAVFLTGNDTVIYKYGASDSRHWDARPNDLLMWSAISAGCARGFVTFDLGRSDLAGDGLRQFKASWGADELPLVYSAVGGDAHVDAAAAAGRVAGVIRRSPLWVSRALGALFYRYAA